MIITSDDDEKELLCLWKEGSEVAAEKLIALYYEDFLKIASIMLRAESNNSLHSGDLANSAIVRILKTKQFSINDEIHLKALAAKVMRRVLVDKARKRDSLKRKGLKISFNEYEHLTQSYDVDIVALEVGLLRLKASIPHGAKIVELKIFGNMTIEDISDVLSISQTEVKATWRACKGWLKLVIKNEI